MPRLFDIGMHSGDPLVVLQNKLANVKFKTVHKEMQSVRQKQYKTLSKNS